MPITYYTNPNGYDDETRSVRCTRMLCVTPCNGCSLRSITKAEARGDVPAATEHPRNLVVVAEPPAGFGAAMLSHTKAGDGVLNPEGKWAVAERPASNLRIMAPKLPLSAREKSQAWAKNQVVGTVASYGRDSDGNPLMWMWQAACTRKAITIACSRRAGTTTNFTEGGDILHWDKRLDGIGLSDVMIK